MEHLPHSLLDKYGRLLSLDFYRGLTMFLLVAEAAGLWHSLNEPYFEGTVIGAIATQFHHHPWNGLRFWDLVQPFFMFIVGVAMPISFGKRWERGDSWPDTFRHALTRSLTLLALGVGVYCVTAGHLVFELWNVLAQLSFTYLVAFLVMRKSSASQIGVTVGLLLLTEALYRLWPVAGFNQPFMPDHNFGSWLDMILMGKLSGGHWVAFNAVPTAAHTIWGVLAGQVLISDRATKHKLRTLVIAGLILVVVGYALNPVTPIIKRIATTSFTIVTGGWCLLALVFSFWAIDVKKFQTGIARFFATMGMNPLFIYMFSLLGGAAWLGDITGVFTEGFLGWFGIPLAVIGIVTAVIVQAMQWYLTYFLCDNRIFIKI